MNLPEGKLTNGLVIANVVIFLLIWVFKLEQDAIIRGGFFAIRFDQGFNGFSDGMWAVPAWLTPLSSAFLHGGLMHLGFNMLMLVYCGRFVEQALGPQLMGTLYVVGAYAAAFAEYAFGSDPLVPVIGASGSISAILGAYALLFARNQVKAVGPIPGNIVRILWLALAWIGIQLLIGIASSGDLNGIAIFAHIGGFVAGLLLTKPLLQWRFRNA